MFRPVLACLALPLCTLLTPFARAQGPVDNIYVLDVGSRVNQYYLRNLCVDDTSN